MRNKAFTLIELLVVISIIGLLSSIVLASLNTAREKGRIGSARYFAAQVDHIAGDSAVGIWNFDECSNASADDLSGNGNTAAIQGTPTPSTNTVTGKGCALDVNGTSGQYARISDSASLDLVDNFTVSLWVNLRNTASVCILCKGDSTIHGASLAYGFGTNGFQFIAWNTQNSPYDIQRSSDLNRWHFLVGVVSSGVRSLYVDGVLVSSSSSSGNSWNNTNDLHIGRAGVGLNSNNTNGLIDDVRVFAKTLTASEIQAHYAESAPKYEFAANVQ